MFHQYFYPAASLRYRPIQLDLVRQSLARICASPVNIRSHLRQCVYIPSYLRLQSLNCDLYSLSTSVILRVVYGIKTAGAHDEYVAVAHEALKGFNNVMVPGTYWIEYLPFPDYVPSWLPGASAKRGAEDCSAWVRRMIEEPYQAARVAIVCLC